jgi:hypothetical protein
MLKSKNIFNLIKSLFPKFLFRLKHAGEVLGNEPQKTSDFEYTGSDNLTRGTDQPFNLPRDTDDEEIFV